MQLTVKTLKGEKFVVNTEPSNTIAEVKNIIEAAKSELPAINMKLIHSGKVLKDSDSVESCNIKPNAFLVVMIAKAKKTAAATPTPSETATDTKTASTSAAASEPATVTESSSSSSATVPPPSSSTSESIPVSTSDEVPEEVVSNLIAMGFPEAEVRACLRASQGNPDIAVEFLTNGIPPAVRTLQAGGSLSSTSGATSSTTSDGTLSALRNHPQINQLRALVRDNPSTLQAVLTQIGQQQPELLQEINSNQELFLQIMNEPVEEDANASSPAAPSSSSASPSSAPSVNPEMLRGISDPAQMAQLLQNMDPNQVQSLAALMGLTPEQLTMTAQMIGRMPQAEFQNYVNSAMQGGMGGLARPGGEAGTQVLELSQEEMAAVDRLADMGFNRSEAAQAYIACDKNEALAANLLMDGGFGFEDDGGNTGGGGGSSGNNDNDGDDMYN